MKSKRTTGCFNGDGKHPPKISMSDVISSRCKPQDTSDNYIDKNKMLEDIKNLEERYNQLYKYVCVDNFGNTKGCEYFEEMELIKNRLNFLNNLIKYII
jgi:hypothetical protein